MLSDKTGDANNSEHECMILLTKHILHRGIFLIKNLNNYLFFKHKQIRFANESLMIYYRKSRVILTNFINLDYVI